MDLLHKIVKIYKNEESNFITNLSSDERKYIALYSFYHYFNGDSLKIEELNSGFCESDEEIINSSFSNGFSLVSIYENCTIDSEAIDFIFSIEPRIFNSFIEDNFEQTLSLLGKKVEDIIIKNKNEDNSNAINIYSSINPKLNNEMLHIIKVFCPIILDNDDKFYIQQKISEFEFSNDKIIYEIFFIDDVKLEVESVESPKEYVTKGILTLISLDSICYFGEEKSFITLISAKSLKSIYSQYGTQGLLASNLRFFVSSKKIDPKIIDTIKNNGDNFAYFNNGIIITCENYKIKNNILELYNFSIVNGGQTTNLIGRTFFEDDFSVVCKVIKNKYTLDEDKVEFLSKVAEASNTQKPINAKDLIANRKEQRLLKLQFANAGMFLKVKRGEKIDLSQYKEKWQNASNDEIAQLIYSCVYQSPGTSKNSKSKILQNEKIYDKIFKNSYSDVFFISIQKLKVAYNDYQRSLKKSINKSSVKYGLSKHANLMSLSIICLVYKCLINKEVRDYLMSLPEVNINNSNETLKSMLSQNDIGKLNFIKEYLHNIIVKTTFDSLFNNIFSKVLIPAYELFKKDYPNYSYSNFFKTDLYYYNYIVLVVYKLIKNPKKYSELNSLFNPFFDLDQKPKTSVFNDNPVIHYTSLTDELREYKKNVYIESGGKIESYRVITDLQITNIVKLMPKTKEDLAVQIKMKKNQIKDYGNKILEIVNKYNKR